MALSDAWLRSVVGKERDKVLVKSDRDGLSVRVSPKGRVVFQYRYQWAGKGERLDIGTYPATGLKEAREEAVSYTHLDVYKRQAHGERLYLPPASRQ